MSSFAKGTTVTVAKSRSEIEHMLSRYGVSKFQSGWDQDQAAILFEKNGRRIRFTLNLPSEAEFAKADKNSRSPTAMKSACEAEHRRLWRALTLVIKAKLESVESGIESFESAFLSHVVVPGSNQTFGEWASPQIAAAYERGLNMPKMLEVGQ